MADRRLSALEKKHGVPAAAAARRAIAAETLGSFLAVE